MADPSSKKVYILVSVYGGVADDATAYDTIAKAWEAQAKWAIEMAGMEEVAKYLQWDESNHSLFVSITALKDDGVLSDDEDSYIFESELS